MLGKVTNSIDQHGQTKLQKRCGTTPRADSIDKKVTKIVNNYLKNTTRTPPPEDEGSRSGCGTTPRAG